MASFVDVEDDSILAAIFKEAFPDSCGDSAEFAQYLAELSSYGVEKLNREPGRLADERTQILGQTQDLAFHNYKTFIQTAECCREIFQDFQVIEKHVDQTLSKLPELNQRCTEFIKEAHGINNRRKMNGLTLGKHSQLLELLEVPQLMDTCVRNSYYEEALELAAHVKRLEKRHASIPVIQSLVEEVKASSQLMLSQLVQQLRSNVQLPACLRVIGYLRRMDVYSEAELRIKFLQARDSWFQSVLRGIPADDPYYHINKTVEASRVHLFDIITQYRAIFSDDDPVSSALRDSSRQCDSLLFHGWVLQKVSQFLSTLEADLGRGVRGRLDSLLGQCMYFGLSFSRVGADFRGLLAEIFQRAALRGFAEAMKEADDRLVEMFDSYTLMSTQSITSSSVYGLAMQTSGPGLHPPASLLEFTPLAVYCNGVLGALNELRLCAPLALTVQVSRMLQASLCRVVDAVLVFHRVDETTFSEAEEKKLAQLCLTFSRDLVPFLVSCLQAVFPPSQLCLVLGVSATELGAMEMMGNLNVEDIVRPLSHLIPELPEPIRDSQLDSDLQNAVASTAAALPTVQEAAVASTAPNPAATVQQAAASSTTDQVSASISPAAAMSTVVGDLETANSPATEVTQCSTQELAETAGSAMNTRNYAAVSDTSTVDSISRTADASPAVTAAGEEQRSGEAATVSSQAAASSANVADSLKETESVLSTDRS